MTTVQNSKIKVVYQRASYVIYLEEENLQAFLADNNLKEGYYIRRHLNDSFAYYNILHHLFNISQNITLYTNSTNPTLYQPPLPPRLFTTLFQNLTSKLWPQLVEDINECVAFAPGYIQCENKKIQTCHDIFSQLTYKIGDINIKTQGFLFLNDVWLNIDGILYPIYLYLHILLHYSYSPDSLDNAYNRDLREDLFHVITTLEGFKPRLPNLEL